MLKKLSLFFVLFLTLVMSAIPQTAFAAKNSGSIQVKGSDTMVNLVQAWAEEFMKVHPEAFIAVTGGGSGTGLAALINGTCDVAVSSREIKKQEIALAEKKGVTPKEVKVALDGLAVVVHPENSVSQLTMDQLADIFSGKISNWKDLGGPDAKIVILSREVNSGTHVYFKEHVLRKNDSKSTEEFAPDALLMSSSQAIADEVASNKAAIGYYGMGYISAKHKALLVAKTADAPYEPPTVEHVIKGDYPISRPLYFYTKNDASADVQKFVDYILSAEGQSLVTKLDFVPIQA
jgi:phosphate transport system substrate-binding protein